MNDIKKALFLLVLAISVLAFSGCTNQDGISTFTQCSAPEEMALSSLTLDERFIDCIVQEDQYVFLRENGWLLWTDTDGERTQEVQLSLPKGSRAHALVLTDKDLLVFGEDRDGLWAMTTDGDVHLTGYKTHSGNNRQIGSVLHFNGWRTSTGRGRRKCASND